VGISSLSVLLTSKDATYTTAVPAPVIEHACLALTCRYSLIQMRVGNTWHWPQIIHRHSTIGIERIDRQSERSVSHAGTIRSQ
jgi:hypothetical protein